MIVIFELVIVVEIGDVVKRELRMGCMYFYEIWEEEGVTDGSYIFPVDRGGRCSGVKNYRH